MSAEEDVRSAQLHKVFLKALDVSVEAVGPEVTRDSFESVKGAIGLNNVEAIIVKQLGKLKHNVEVSWVLLDFSSLNVYNCRENLSSRAKGTMFASIYLKVLAQFLCLLICKDSDNCTLCRCLCWIDFVWRLSDVVNETREIERQHLTSAIEEVIIWSYMFSIAFLFVYEVEEKEWEP